MLADDALGALDPGLGQERLLVLAALDEAFGLEPLQHLAGGRSRDAEHLGDPDAIADELFGSGRYSPIGKARK